MTLIDRKVARSRGTATFTVTHLGTDGDTVFHRTLSYRPKASSASFADSIREAQERDELDVPRLVRYRVVGRPGLDAREPSS